jgi:hypothetical protein
MVMNTKRFDSRHAGVALAVLIAAVLSLPANAAEIWKVNLAKSKFSSSTNTLVLERDSAKASAQNIGGNTDSGANTFLVIAHRKIYLATDEAASDASNRSVRTVDYTAWRGMKLVQIGEKVRPADICGFSCQAGLRDSRMTLTFTSNGVDPSRQMSKIVVFNDEQAARW